jgi:hypothetical protein
MQEHDLQPINYDLRYYFIQNITQTNRLNFNHTRWIFYFWNESNVGGWNSNP